MFISIAQAELICPDGDAKGLVPCYSVTSDDLVNIFVSIRDFLLVVGIILIIIFIVLTGIKFMTARGDEGQVADARQMFFWTVIGATVVLGAFVILQTIIGILNSKGFINLL